MFLFDLEPGIQGFQNEADVYIDVCSIGKKWQFLHGMCRTRSCSSIFVGSWARHRHPVGLCQEVWGPGAHFRMFEAERPADGLSYLGLFRVVWCFFVYFPNGKSTHISGKPLSKSENMSNLRDQMMFELPLVDVKLHRASSQRFDFDQWRQLICCFGERLQPPTMSESRGITSGPQPYFL